jgi:protein-tyrosine phosphatase
MPGGSPVNRDRILFVCTANIDRSRTAEDLYADDPRYEVRSAGTAPFATLPLTRDLLLWADRIFVMNEREDSHATLIKMRFPGVDRPIVDLDIEDRWRRGDPELVSRLRKKLSSHLGAPRKAGESGS